MVWILWAEIGLREGFVSRRGRCWRPVGGRNYLICDLIMIGSGCNNGPMYLGNKFIIAVSICPLSLSLFWRWRDECMKSRGWHVRERGHFCLFKHSFIHEGFPISFIYPTGWTRTVILVINCSGNQGLALGLCSTLVHWTWMSYWEETGDLILRNK